MNRRKILSWLSGLPLLGLVVPALAKSSDPRCPEIKHYAIESNASRKLFEKFVTDNAQRHQEFLSLSDFINSNPIYKKYHEALIGSIKHMNNPEELKKIRQDLENYWGHEAVLDENFDKDQQEGYDRLKERMAKYGNLAEAPEGWRNTWGKLWSNMSLRQRSDVWHVIITRLI